ncbi:hypothetical protein BN2476_1240042 [Paraburkholderia piptadeniae]|uniref:Tyr recombinase domain-containing protein n=1 Tax=Paraburkholderia piptadeniae TaxID=1701573 RepID=A0A1N7SVV4_9BURK|nr:tyrosine-type recombinase/integrase [Paraburkholderia piptadeniae]SIT51581.1 hypothetical protein BN2476_1240042 [Paraburkholderia piptadeniae]
MITQVVSEVVACNRARYGALGPIVGHFADYLGRHGYAGITVENYLQCACLELSDIDAPLVLQFLDHLEVARHNSIRSRNLRLAAIRSFLRYAASRVPESLGTIQQVLAIPMKRYERPLVRFLSREEICALLDAPNPNTWCGQRDRVMLATLYNTGARVSELIGIRVGDVDLDRSPSVRLHGKGRKERAVPLWRSTANQIRLWLQQIGASPGQWLFPNRSGGFRRGKALGVYDSNMMGTAYIASE